MSVLFSGLCPDWETWDPSQPVENAREAMQQADDWLGVPQVTSRPHQNHDPQNIQEHLSFFNTNSRFISPVDPDQRQETMCLKNY